MKILCFMLISTTVAKSIPNSLNTVLKSQFKKKLSYILAERLQAYEFIWPSVDIYSPQLQRLPVRGLAICFHGNRIKLFVCLLVIIATKQAAALLPLWTTPTHLPPFPPLYHNDPSHHPLIPHPILSGFILRRLYVCHSIHYPSLPPLSPAPWFTAGRKAWFELIYCWFYVYL